MFLKERIFPVNAGSYGLVTWLRVFLNPQPERLLR
jgi:hypothetical protein